MRDGCEDSAPGYDATIWSNNPDRPPEQTGGRDSSPQEAQTASSSGGQEVDASGPSAVPGTADPPVRVLLVDDEPGYAETVSEYLERHDGIDEVVTETDPREALAAVDGTVDCIVSDYAMPGLDGLELLAAVREEHPDLPFVMLTGQGEEETAVEAISAGVTEYFRKQSGTDQYARLAHRVSNVIRQYRAGQAVAATQRQYTRLIEKSTDVVTILDTEGRFRYLSPAVERRLGYPAEALLDRPLVEFVHPADRDTALHQFAMLMEEPGREVSVEFRFEQRDGSWLWVEARSRNLLDDPDIEGLVMHARDITDRKQYEQTLTALHDSSRALLGAESATDVAESVVSTGTDVLSMSVVAVYLLDPASGMLSPVAVSGETVDKSTLSPLAPGHHTTVGETFLAGEPRTARADGGEATLPDLPLDWVFILPLGTHGVCVIGDTESEVTDVDRELVETLMATAGTALDRVERGTKLQERKTELEEQNRQLEQLRQLNATVREVGATITQADTRAAIERGVCANLSAADGITLVRLSGHDTENQQPITREWAGNDQASGYLDAGSAALEDSTEPAARAAATDEPVYVGNTADSLSEEPWRKTALAHGVRAVLSLPLSYRGISYGTLTVYAERADFFDELSRLALIDLSNKIANVTNTVEHQQAVLSETMTEVTIRFTDDDVAVHYIASRAGCSLTLETVTPRSGGDMGKYVRVDGANIDTVTRIAAEVAEISDALPATDGGENSVVELRFSSKPLTEYLANRGIRVIELTADPDSALFTLSVPDNVDIRGFFGDLPERYGDPTLVAKSERGHTDTGSKEQYRSELTPRQREVLRTAHTEGFFESPRACTGEALADDLGISPQTFYRHIRTAERQLFDTVFEQGG